MKNARQLKFLEIAVAEYGVGSTISPKQMQEIADEHGFSSSDIFWLAKPQYRAGRGLYVIPALPDNAAAMAADIVPLRKPAPVAAPAVERPVAKKFDPNAVSEYEYAQVPDRDKTYVAFGEFKLIRDIISSGQFFPVFISGHSGNGKTFMVEQACSAAKRPMIRVQMSRETDEDDLIGGFRLIDGETKFMKGPVLRAMELGALLLIDEADRADPGKAMCLQGILEGKPYYMKKTGEIVTPAAGFNIIVTANTKGRGSEDGRYVAATMLDDAWLERFPITIEQEYPTIAVEKRILGHVLEDQGFIDHLTMWSDIIRRTFKEGAIDELISTRRLVHIARTFGIVGDRMKAINFCINRFDEETKTAFLDLYSKVDPTINPVVDPAPATDEVASENAQEIPS